MKSTFLIAVVALAGSLFFFSSSSPGQDSGTPKVVILGVDGLDPKLLQKFMDAGLLPNFEKLVGEGDFTPLQTTMPPLSPVAWSTFITGMDAGGHGIYDFLHRDPATLTPQFSMSKASAPARTLEVGSWVIPLSEGKVHQLRKGEAFWEVLTRHQVPTTIYRMPANFPPAGHNHRALSGMGTPDILGTPGTFSFYTSSPPENANEISGGQVFEVQPREGQINAQLIGPENPFRKFSRQVSGAYGAPEKEYYHPQMKVDFKVYLDSKEAVAKFVLQGQEFLLKEGEWSDWIQINFEAVPYLVGVSALGRFYLQEVRPDFRLYVSPLQINPEDPAMPIATPETWSAELAEELGYFYTQELPEDTKAFSGGIFSGSEFWDQSQYVFAELRKMLDYALDNYEEGLLFFYFSSVDQGSHMLWQYMDPEHPAYTPDSQLRDGIQTLYRQMDEVLGKVMASIDDDTTLIVMSDHGFSPFYWGVNLNSWLLEKGYVQLKNPEKQGEFPLLLNVDWSKTKAYALGLNGIYVNMQGREKQGIVPPGPEYDRLIEQLRSDLLSMKDPRNDRNPVTLVLNTRKDLHGQYLDQGPDLIVGYNYGYRSSWKNPLGEFPRSIFVDNVEAWSGDHSIDYRLVPGVLISNRSIKVENPALYDLTVSVLNEFGVGKTQIMLGEDVLSTAPENKEAHVWSKSKAR